MYAEHSPALQTEWNVALKYHVRTKKKKEKVSPLLSKALKRSCVNKHIMGSVWLSALPAWNHALVLLQDGISLLSAQIKAKPCVRFFFFSTASKWWATAYFPTINKSQWGDWTSLFRFWEWIWFFCSLKKCKTHDWVCVEGLVRRQLYLDSLAANCAPSLESRPGADRTVGHIQRCGIDRLPPRKQSFLELCDALGDGPLLYSGATQTLSQGTVSPITVYSVPTARISALYEIHVLFCSLLCVSFLKDCLDFTSASQAVQFLDLW